MTQTVARVQLKPETLQAFDSYIQDAEREMEPSLHDSGTFLWCLADSPRAKLVRKGNVEVQFWSGDGPVRVPGGLIHDWVGAAFAPSTTVARTLALVQDYDHHKAVYRPEVIESKLLSHHGNDFQIYLRLLKKKVITVVLDTEHDVHYSALDAMSWSCRSHTTRIAEVENGGTAKEEVSQPDTGYGFLWRLYSYWRFQERESGVFLECRAISLSRDVPKGLGWLIDPIVRKLPRESLVKTLADTLEALKLSQRRDLPLTQRAR
jgi:hypothetical protein